MSSDKKLTLKRIIIFILIAFVPLIIIVAVVNAFFDEPIYVSETPEALATSQLLGFIGMMTPTIANIITRIITKEGFKNSYLKINLKGNIKYYVLSVVVPLIYVIATMCISFMTYSKEFTLSEMVDFSNIPITIGGTLLSLSAIFYFFIPFFGEEFGWRAYLTPKLTELMPEPVAVFVSGIIWGLWHAPLTCVGHNFGVDYPFFPFLGILMMCIMCVCMSSFLTLLTKRTGSVFPAALAHGANNQLTGVIISFLATEEFLERFSSEQNIVVIEILPIVIVGIISYIILIMDYMKKKKEA